MTPDEKKKYFYFKKQNKILRRKITRLEKQLNSKKVDLPIEIITLEKEVIKNHTKIYHSDVNNGLL